MSKVFDNKSKKSIAFVVAAPVTAEAFLAPHIRHLADKFQITVIGKGITQSESLDPRANMIDITIERRINIKSDLKACIALFKILRHEKFDVVQSMTPKAGLLTALAGFAARIPTRIHWFTGQVWTTKSGFSRRFLKSLDRTTAALSTHLLVDSHSQKQFLERNRVAKSTKMNVLGHGSTRGVDCEQFRMDLSRSNVVRRQLNIPNGDKIILFVGRLNREKGVQHLLDAFCLLPANLNAHLVLVGADEEGFLESSRKCNNNLFTNIIYVGYQTNVLDYLIDADIFVLPSYREGLPISLLEACAVGLPIIGTEINGIIDVVENGVNGILVPAANTEELFEALYTLLSDMELRKRLGEEAMKTVNLCFREQELTRAYEKFLMEIISQAKFS